jgi:hypothetical protein
MERKRAGIDRSPKEKSRELIEEILAISAPTHHEGTSNKQQKSKRHKGK